MKSIPEILRTMDESQLIQLFREIDDIVAIQRISDCSYAYIEDHPELEEPEDDTAEQELKRQDDLQRYRDIKSMKDSL